MNHFLYPILFKMFLTLYLGDTNLHFFFKRVFCHFHISACNKIFLQHYACIQRNKDNLLNSFENDSLDFHIGKDTQIRMKTF